MTDISCPELSLFKKGKVRHVYDLGESLCFVASDRVSAFDHNMPNGIPGKGALLTQVSVFWFNFLKDIISHHLITANLDEFPAQCMPYKEVLKDRSMIVKKTELIEIECVVRGYLAGSGWKEYQENGTVCGHTLPSGLRLADPLPEPIFTPAIKASDGHDENISIDKMKDIIGDELSQILIEKSQKIYQLGRDYVAERGIILADTKFEFGQLNGEVILIDEVLTPDSSRYWPKEDYAPGISPPSFDKQIVRDYLENSGWNKESPAPALPNHIVDRVVARYQDLYNRLLS